MAVLLGSCLRGKTGDENRVCMQQFSILARAVTQRNDDFYHRWQWKTWLLLISAKCGAFRGYR